VSLIQSSLARPATLSVQVWTVSQTQEVVSTEATVDLPHGTTQWVLGRRRSLLAMARSNQGGIKISEYSLRDGRLMSIARIPESFARFMRGVDGTNLLWAKARASRRLARIEDGHVDSIHEVRGDVCYLDADRTGVRAGVLADRSSRAWYVQIAGRTVLGRDRITMPCKVRGLQQQILQATPARGIVYLPSIFGARNTWAQNSYFQHVLSSLAKSLQSEGYTYRIARLPGAGCVVDLRTLVALAAESVNAAVSALRARGCERIGVLAGSLGAYGILRTVDSIAGVSALMLLSPVHWVSPAIASRLSLQGCDEDSDVELSLRNLRMSIVTPVSIIHGVRDEVTPSYHSFVFASARPYGPANQYHPVPEEGHVFSRFSSWKLVANRFRTFADLHCAT
jgi:hypothetical protein